ncbi:MAG: uncharacterized protein QG656_2710 [Candidatus Hydrogenedentes bacterium]|nr:uncharacterized protein [Candidatus Hydrogenedentota bacterium]
MIPFGNDFYGPAGFTDEVGDVKLNFFPRTYDFDACFLRQNAAMREAASALDAIFSDPANVAQKVKKIQDCESDGNDLTREIATHLSLTFITSIDREDIHNLSVVQKEVLTLIKAIATRIGLYRLEKIDRSAVELADGLKSMIDVTGEMLARYVAKQDVSECSSQIKHLKAHADMFLLVALGEIYERDASSPGALLEIIKWSHIFDRIEQAIVRTEDLANVIEGISLKYA